MNWLVSLRDQLPQLLVVCPLIGSVVAGIAAWAQSDCVRQLALSNLFCSLLICGGVAWQREAEIQAESFSRHPSAEELEECGSDEAAIAVAHRRVDRQRAERLDRQFFAVDGLNLWPTAAMLVLSGIVLGKAGSSSQYSAWFLVLVLVLQTASIASLMAIDLLVFLISYGTAAFAMSALLGLWGGRERRALAERLLANQFRGAALVMLGFAMLAVTIPWMKFEDAPSPLGITLNISSATHEIQKWTAANGVAYQYALDVLPWMLLVTCVGFALLFGAFPFHATQVAILGDASPDLAILYIAGFLPLSAVGWFRFVLPIAPDLLVEFDWLILFSGLCGAMWAGLRSWSPISPRQRMAFVFSSLMGMALLGCFSFSRFGMSGAWLMLQQLSLAFSVGLLILAPATSDQQLSADSDFSDRLTPRALLLILAAVCVGLYSSGFVIVTELFRELISSIASIEFEASAFEMLLELSSDFLMVSVAVLSVLFVATTVFSIVTNGARSREFTTQGNRLASVSLLLLLVIVNFLPNVMLHLCEPDFARVFRRFERTLPAASAGRDTDERQTSP